MTHPSGPGGRPTPRPAAPLLLALAAATVAGCTSTSPGSAVAGGTPAAPPPPELPQIAASADVNGVPPGTPTGTGHPDYPASSACDLFVDGLAEAAGVNGFAVHEENERGLGLCILVDGTTHPGQTWELGVVVDPHHGIANAYTGDVTSIEPTTADPFDARLLRYADGMCRMDIDVAEDATVSLMVAVGRTGSDPAPEGEEDEVARTDQACSVVADISPVLAHHLPARADGDQDGPTTLSATPSPG
ncbi:hypothetical protein C1701_16410 [Actinoalloteichus sp. AHMU CJ021]|uniref:DUF3558 domain-containing protein n=1 Tax=Actinoalloteichus caeruleus DSM 43889 TaxID=1120930 RepID=A0ABT1JMN7_ACTCY|nr:hypothetical protein [Actinoalloteichus caeruleus]AUS79670.1 hypothetical protein C1701_16410 [Actinoalloteichus sp. AHMU CJ021]MCP2333788.1 hypothetical protein [Actinoalloteichus caeruleus DSM 43889]